MPHLSLEQTRSLALKFSVEIDHLEACAECRDRLREVVSDQDRGYRDALARAAEGTLRRIPAVRAEKAAAPERLAELLELSEVQQASALALEPRFRSYALASYILRCCEAEVFHQPERARRLARLARAITERVDPRSCGGIAALADLEAYSLAMEGEALRTSGSLERSLRSFAEARLHQERGGVDPELGARVDMLEAGLRRDLGQTRLALELLDRAAEAFIALREHDQLARLVLHRPSFLRVRAAGEAGAFPSH